MSTGRDPNLSQKTANMAGLKFLNILETPLVVTGFPFLKENGDFNRVPNNIMNQLPELLAWVAPQPSGGMIRFKTNSKRISIKADLLRNETSRNCSQNLLSGFDVYVDNEFIGNICGEENPMSFCSELQVSDSEMKSITIYTPLQNPLKQVEIGLEEDAKILQPDNFAIQKPILFYGSSITCGFCASRPGLTYPARITRNLNANLINYGFGGSACGELSIAQTIGSLDLSCFVMDYDFNSPSIEHLEQTHESFFKEVRRLSPDLPIIIVSSIFLHKGPDYFLARRDIIKKTYDNAIKSGDINVYFIDGSTFFEENEWAEYTVDRLHPNDLGFARMTNKIQPFIERL